MLAAAAGAHAAVAPAVRLPGHVLPYLSRATPLAEHDAAQPVTVSIVLRRRDPDGFARYLHDVYDRSAPTFHRFLGQADIADRFGPSRTAYARVLEFLRERGFEGIHGSANRMTVTAKASRAVAERAFGVDIGDFELDGRRFFANDEEPSVPRDMAADVQAVIGLSSAPAPKPAQNELIIAIMNGLWADLNELYLLRAEAFAASDLFSAADAAAMAAFDAEEALIVGELMAQSELLVFEVLEAERGSDRIRRKAGAGDGQKIGVLSFSNFRMSDVADWLVFSKRPASLLGQISQVHVNGGAPLGSDQTEPLLNIEAILGVAPAAQIVVYDAPFAGSGTSFQALFNAMIDDGVDVISNTWSYCEDQTTLADAQSIDAILATAAASGISVFNATGDSGSTCRDGSANVIAVPADSPHATAVGGSAPVVGPGQTYGGETWFDGSSHVPPTGQGGFGVSQFFTRPGYQAGVVAGAMRSIPDVVAVADPALGLSVCSVDAGGCPAGTRHGGTSLATPIWAALTALLNQALGHDVGLLNPNIYPLAGSSAFHSAASMGTDAAHVGLGSPNWNQLYLELAGKSPGAGDAHRSRLKVISSRPLVPFLGGVPADGTTAVKVRVTLHDADGNLVPGKAVTLLASAGSHAAIAPASATTSVSDGAAVFTVTNATIENVTFTAKDVTDNVVLADSATVKFTGPPPAAAGITANPPSVPADGAQQATIDVTLQDSHGQGIAGKVIALSQGSGHSILVAPNPAETDANGHIQFLASDNVAEAVTYAAIDVTDGNLALPGSATVTFTGGGSSCVGAPPTAANGFALTPFATGFFAQNFFFGNVNWGGCPGASNPTFAPSGAVYVADFPSGDLYKFTVAGGAVSNANKLGNLGKTLGQPTFGRDGRLYATLSATTGDFHTGRIVEIDPSDGSLVRVVASNLTCPGGLVVDPLSGDLFFDDGCTGAGSDDPSVWRIHDPASTAVMSVYATLPGTPNGQIAIAPDGTMFAIAQYFNNPNAPVIRISGTNVSGPPTVAAIPGLASDNGSVTIGSVQGNGAARTLILHTGGVLRAVDITVDPFTTQDLANGPTSTGVIGPDGCLFTSANDTLLRLAPTSGACNFVPSSPAPSLSLTPSAVTPDPHTGDALAFTATFNNVTVPAGTPVTLTVIGPNMQAMVGHTDAQGHAAFTLQGAFAGTDVVRATATAGTQALTSNATSVNWLAGAHATFLSLDGTPTSGNAGASVTLKATLVDVSVAPAAVLPGQPVQFSLGSVHCAGNTNAAGVATCAVVPGAGTVQALSAAFPGTSGSTRYLASNAAGQVLLLGGSSVSPPGAPVVTNVVPADGSLALYFTPPANDGGAAITGYTASCTPTGGGGAITAQGSHSPIVVSGLVNGVTYACTVTASNTAGPGPASAPASATVAAVALLQPIPTLDPFALALLALTLAGFAAGVLKERRARR
jgi:hypothetical protein